VVPSARLELSGDRPGYQRAQLAGWCDADQHDGPQGDDVGREGSGWSDARFPDQARTRPAGAGGIRKGDDRDEVLSGIDAKPPLDLNKETMDRYRAEMAKHYLNRTVRFN
jgi:hypothetical protein